MRKTGLLILALIILAFPVLSSGQQQGRGEVSGRVVNKSPGGNVPSQLEVSLLAMAREGFTVKGKTSAANNGEFRFSGIDIAGQANFLVTAKYLNVDYFSRPVSLSPDAARARVELPIFELTKDTKTLRIRNIHAVVEPDKGFATVTLIVVAGNSGDKTVWAEAIPFSLPQGYSQISSIQGIDHQAVKVSEEGLTINKPFPPGDGQFFLTFKLGYKSSALMWRQRLDYPTDNLNLFFPQEMGKVTSDILREGQPFQMKGQMFRRFQAASLAKDSQVLLTVSGLPGMEAGFTKPLAIGFAVLIFAGLVYGLLRKRLAEKRKPAES